MPLETPVARRTSRLMKESRFGRSDRRVGNDPAMMFRRPAPPASTLAVASLDGFHEWALNLPWVVEMPAYPDMPGVRSFAVDCEPLDRRQLWLVTGLARDLTDGNAGIAVILPLEAADAVEVAGWGRRAATLPARHVLLAACDDAALRPREVEALALSAYTYAML